MLPDAYNNGLDGGTYAVNRWFGNRVYSTRPLRYYDLNAGFQLIKDSVPFAYTETNHYPSYPVDSVIHWVFSIDVAHDGSKLLCVRSLYTDVSLGELQEISTATWLQHSLLDSSYNVSRGIYLSEDSIVYYSFGRTYSRSNPTPPDAGYYLLVKSTREMHLLLHHTSNLGASEMMNGFDVAPDHHTLLIPSVGEDRAPFLYEFHFDTGSYDTLAVPFDKGNGRWCLYVKYNHDGSKILYSQYPIGSIVGPVNDGSEVGIIDRSSLIKHVLDTNPYPGAYKEISLFPDWSPDEKSIVYGSAQVSTEPFGNVSLHIPTILKYFK